MILRSFTVCRASFPTPPVGAEKLPMAGCSGGIVLELVCWFVGLGLILFYMTASIRLEELRQQGVSLFSEARASASDSRHLNDLSLGVESHSQDGLREMDPAPDRPGTGSDAALPIAVLRIAGLDLEVPVYRELNELNLSRGAGWIGGTAAPNTVGNMAIAAHRDRYFRPLKDIRIGDPMVLESLSGQVHYRVSRLDIVDPEDVSVLDDSEVTTVTLVTCYPFYFIGNAPQRYIVQATAVDHPEKAPRPEVLLTAPPSGETP